MEAGGLSADTGHRSHRAVGVVAVILVCLIGVVYIWSQVPLGQRIPRVADSRADWLVTTAFWDGADPYAPIAQLADTYQSDYLSPLAPTQTAHPRLPGALLLQWPLVLQPEVKASYGLAFLGLGALIAVALFLSDVLRPRPLAAAALPFALMFSGVSLWNFVWVAQSAVVACVVALIVLCTTRWRRPIAAGLLLALAATLKPFVLILLIPWLMEHRWRAFLSTLAGLGIINGAALAISPVSVSDVRRVLSESFETWFQAGSNISFGALINRVLSLELGLVVPIHLLLIGMWWVLSRKIPRGPVSYVGWLAIGVLASPLAWSHYLLVLIPVAWIALNSEIPPFSKLLLALGVAAFFPIDVIPWYPIGIVMILMGVLASRSGRASPLGA